MNRTFFRVIDQAAVIKRRYLNANLRKIASSSESDASQKWPLPHHRSLPNQPIAHRLDIGKLGDPRQFFGEIGCEFAAESDGVRA